MVLTVFVSAGLSLSTVQTSDMTVKMAMGSDMSVAGNGDCTACPDGADDSGNPIACPPICMAPVLAMLPQDLTVATAIQTSQLSSLPCPLRHGWGLLPDPYPPRPSDLV